MASVIGKRFSVFFLEIFRVSAAGALGDRLFIRNFRDGGLQSVVVACYASIALLVCFIAFPVLSNNYIVEAVWIRLVMLAALIAVLFVIRGFRDVVLDYYVFIVGGACALLFGSISIILAHPEIAAIGAGFGAMPVVIFGLFLMYAFLRLPVFLMLIIGISYSAMVCLLSAGEFFGVGGARMVLYLICFNILGLVLASTVERREWYLYQQSLLLRESRDQSRLRAEMAERAYSEKMRLVAAINHDLRQPMSAALSSLELLGKVSFVDQKGVGGDILSSAMSALGYLNSTLDHVLTAARLESDRELFQVGRVDLYDLIDRVVMAFDADLFKSGMEIRKAYPSGRIEVISDSGALSRVLLNLIGNGLKFNKSSAVRGRGVLVRVKVKGGACVIHICDTGVGIAESDLESIWEPYKQVGSKDLGNIGLGLGLFLVRGFVSRLPGHSIAVRSRVGFGTKFQVTLPGRHVYQPEKHLDEGDAIGAVDMDRLAGAVVAVIGDEGSAQVKEMCDLLHDLGVFYIPIYDLPALEDFIDGSERALDAIFIWHEPIGFISSASFFEILARSGPGAEPCVFVSDDFFTKDRNWAILGADRFVYPLLPGSVAEGIVRGVVRNIRLESDA